MGFLCTLTVFSCRDKVRSFFIQVGLKLELLVLCIQESAEVSKSSDWDAAWVLSSEGSLSQTFWEETQEQKLMMNFWPENALGSFRRSWRTSSGRDRSEFLLQPNYK